MFTTIPQNPKYEINTDGEVRYIGKEKPLKVRLSRGQPLVTLSEDKGTKHYAVHRLMYETFMDQSPGKVYIKHRDKNKLNNKLDNLYILELNKD